MMGAERLDGAGPGPRFAGIRFESISSNWGPSSPTEWQGPPRAAACPPLHSRRSTLPFHFRFRLRSRLEQTFAHHERDDRVAISVHDQNCRPYLLDLLHGGADLRAVQAMLGHADLGTTEIYTRVAQDHVRAAYDRAYSRA